MELEQVTDAVADPIEESPVSQESGQIVKTAGNGKPIHRAARIAPRQAKPAEQRPEKRSKGPVAILVGAALVVGFGAGALVVRQRNRIFEKQVVVAVNGVPITKDIFYGRLERLAGTTVISTMVKEELMNQFAVSQGTAPTDQEVEERYTKLMQNPIFAASVKRSGMTPEASKRAIKVNLSEIKTVSKGMKATDAELMEYYRKNIDRKNPQSRFYTPENIQIAIIVTSSQERATKAKSRLNTESFDTVAKDVNDEPETKMKGGLVPVFPRGRTKVSKDKSFEDEIFALKIGDTFGPKLRLGKYWIIRCLNKSAEKTQKFEDVKEECREGVLREKGNRERGFILKADLLDFSKKARIQAFWPKYKAAAASAAQ